MNVTELFEVFREEATEAIARLQRLLVEMEDAQPGLNVTAKIQEIFRHAHTLKGSASAVQRMDLAEVAQLVERFREGVGTVVLADEVQVGNRGR